MWGYGIVGLGTGLIRRRRGADDETAAVTGGILATLGAGLGVRITKRMGVHVEGVASGNPGRIGRLAFQVGLARYFGITRRKR